MLGYSGGLHTKDGEYGQVEDNYIMDNVACSGSEATLRDCPHDGSDDCSSLEAAGVVCFMEGKAPRVLAMLSESTFHKKNRAILHGF